MPRITLARCGVLSILAAILLWSLALIIILGRYMCTEPTVIHDGTSHEIESSKGIPKIVWMFWDSGWPAPNTAANLARYSFEHANPTYDVRPLDASLAEQLTERKLYLDDEVWGNLGVASKADIYRMMLLDKYGGVWADASLFCNLPLNTWLNTTAEDLFALRRDDNMQQQQRMKIYPWISSWFLASPPNGYMLHSVLDIVFNVSEHYRFGNDYFWLHRIVSELSRKEEYVAERIRNFPNAGPSHCVGNWAQAPIIKRCKNVDMYSIMATTYQCCPHDNRSNWLSGMIGLPPRTTNWQQVCESWNCFNQTDNLVQRKEQALAAWEAKTSKDAQKLFCPNHTECKGKD